MTHHLHHAGCGCLELLSRRRALGLGLMAAAGATAAIAPPALALDKGYEAMLLKCIDPRFTTDTWKYMTGRGWQNLYSQFNIAGGPIGVVAPTFAAWHKTFWDNLEISYGLHEVKRVVALTHRDCGAAVVAYGDKIKTDRAFETAKHTEALHAFRDELKKRYKEMPVELGIMDLGGAVEVVS
jgi:hypothetical protein